jgi:bifunctional UDP-N-acetylglucosamine pyrophosphorylase/glucosamine-1-phosphate N-acetyltransferase
MEGETMDAAVVILAAGEGTRMKSRRPKVLHQLAGKPMILHAHEVAQAVSTAPPVIVIGVGAEQVRAVVGARARYVVQEEQLGTGHAVLQARSLLADQSELVLVTYGDMPLLRPETLQQVVEHHRRTKPAITILTILRDDAQGFGRVLRTPTGTVAAVVEEADATPEQLEIRELNTGTYCFDADWLWSHLDEIPLSAKGEYYLTDLVGLAVEKGRRVEAVVCEDSSEVLGVNTLVHLAKAEAAFRKRVNESWMLQGVTIVDPATTYIQDGVTLGADTVVHPNTHLQGDTQVGAGCKIGPNTIIRDSTLGDGCQVFASVVEGSILEDDVDIGPFGHLRNGAHLAQGVHMGNFGEVKAAYLGPGVKMGHFSYIGDATIGAGVNIGAGTITCNYDGERKHHTEIEEDAFVGSDTMLVAPVRVGRAAKIGAGSVVTHDVPPDSVVYGVPARVRSESLTDTSTDSQKEKE